MEGPCAHCTDPEHFEVLQDLKGEADFCRCRECGRTYVLGELHLDAMCIETIEQTVWKEMKDPPAGNDPVGYLLENHPYFASSKGGEFHRVDRSVKA